MSRCPSPPSDPPPPIATSRLLVRRLVHGLRWRVRRWLRLPIPPAAFYPAPCVVAQSVTFRFDAASYTMSSDYRTPLYDTVAEIVDYDCYQLARVPRSCVAGDVVIDGGANVGVAAVVLAARFAARVLAFEPVPENHRWLVENLRQNRVTSVDPQLLGLAGADRTDRLWQDPEQSVSAHFNPLLSSARNAGLRPIEAQFVSIPTLLARDPSMRIALLKLDIEGGEHEVLRALAPRHWERIRAVTMEVHDSGAGRNLRAVAARLNDAGYTISVQPHRGVQRGLHYLCGVRRGAA